MAISFFGDSPCDYISNKEQKWESYLDFEMDYYKQDAIKRLQVVVQSNFAEEIAVSLACASEHGSVEAQNILDHVYIDNKHIFALLDDRESLDRTLIDERGYL